MFQSGVISLIPYFLGGLLYLCISQRSQGQGENPFSGVCGYLESDFRQPVPTWLE